MIKAKELLGRRIVALSNGEQIETLSDLIFDYQGNQVLALLVDEGGWFRGAKVIPFRFVRSIGEDVIIVDSPEAVTTASEEPIREALESKVSLLGLNLITTDGKDLGRIADVYFDETTGRVEGYDATGGLFADLSSGRTFVPAPSEVKIGKDSAIVPVTVHDAMQEQDPGGLKGAVLGATSSVKGAVEDMVSATKERQKEYAVGKTAGSDLTLDDGTVIVSRGETITAEHADLAQEHGRLAALATSATSGAIAGAVEDMRSATAERQRSYVVGKTAAQDVTADSGEVIVMKGGVITEHQAARAEELGKLGALTAAATGGAIASGVQSLRESPDPQDPQSALGRRARRDVRAPGGSIVAAQGQIVTQPILDRAQHLGVSADLLRATGLGEDSQSPAAAAVAGPVAGVAATAGTLLEKAKSWLGERSEEAGTALEERKAAAEEARVRDALGRPVNRVILLPDDQILLNIGEIVTHRAVDLARQHEILDMLLDSVTKDAAAVDPLASRPAEPGQASLESQGHAVDGQPASAQPSSAQSSSAQSSPAQPTSPTPGERPQEG